MHFCLTLPSEPEWGASRIPRGLFLLVSVISIALSSLHIWIIHPYASISCFLRATTRVIHRSFDWTRVSRCSVATVDGHLSLGLFLWWGLILWCWVIDVFWGLTDILGGRMEGTLVVLVCNDSKLMGPFLGWFLVGLLAAHDITILLGGFCFEVVGFFVNDFSISLNFFV
jgi:hypothetical protein